MIPSLGCVWLSKHGGAWWCMSDPLLQTIYTLFDKGKVSHSFFHQFFMDHNLSLVTIFHWSTYFIHDHFTLILIEIMGSNKLSALTNFYISHIKENIKSFWFIVINTRYMKLWPLQPLTLQLGFPTKIHLQTIQACGLISKSPRQAFHQERKMGCHQWQFDWKS